MQAAAMAAVTQVSARLRRWTVHAPLEAVQSRRSHAIWTTKFHSDDTECRSREPCRQQFVHLTYSAHSLVFVAAQHSQPKRETTMTLKTPFAAALILAALAMPSFAGDKLNGQQLRGLAPGKYAVSIYGLVKLNINLQSSGTITAKSSASVSTVGSRASSAAQPFLAITAPIPVAASISARFKRFPPKFIALKRPFRCPEGPFSLCFSKFQRVARSRVCGACDKGFR
jgi:hypothetical protein